MSEPWYAARCLFVHRNVDEHPHPLYEERIVLLLADSESDALFKGDEDAKHYAAEGKNVEYTGEIEIYHLFDSTVGDLSEVFSSTRTSPMLPDDYIKRFYNRGKFIGRDVK